jgi:excinuclease ABC subunit A
VKPHKISLKNVRVHNLKNVSIEFPTQELIVFSGVSGSGKSSLAFDTIYTEGQRRYIESLSNYLKKQMGGLPKPEAESIEGITPTIAIEQKSVSKNPRSTVATLTGIQDFLRILFAKIAIPYCPISQEPVKPQTVKQILERIMSLPLKSKWLILAPFAREKKGSFKEDFKDLQKKGFIKVLIDHELYDLTDEISIDPKVHHNIDCVIDRIVIDKGLENRILESIEAALNFHDQTLTLYSLDTKETHFFSTQAYSQTSKMSYSALEAQDFSYNHPKGMCAQCEGLGEHLYFDLKKLIDPKKSLSEECIAYMGSIETVKWGNIYRNLAKIYDFSLNAPFETLIEEQKHVILYGTEKKWTKMQFVHPEKKTRWTEFVQWKGIIQDLQTRYQEATSNNFKAQMEKYMCQTTCPSCHGSRLKPYPSSARLNQKTYLEICSMPLQESLSFFNTLILTDFEKKMGQGLIEEITRRLKFLIEVGLDYLTLYRSAPTLSGGEAQRIRLASQIGSGLIGTTFVLDEPSIGLHPIDNERLIKTLNQLKAQGNTVIVVEHDEDTILSADRVIDIGPSAGDLGGEILSNGTVLDLLNTKRSLTAAFLRGDHLIPIPKERRKPEKFLNLEGATFHNLKNVDVAIPLECLVAVTGVSGSGKSSLILGTLFPVLSNKLLKSDLEEGPLKNLSGLEHLKKVIAIDQTPIGRTPRSNPATYVKIFDDIRELFASLPESKALGFDAGRFSFNVKEGSCHHCQGMGFIKIDMDFMEEDYAPCPLCEGQRFDPQTLSIKYKMKSIFDILEMSITQARLFFENIPHIERKLALLEEVGLGYMKLGQSSTTISGGEAQRVKLAKELIRPSAGKTVYILDEPTTGLHFADISKLLAILNRLVEKKNTVIVIEHNMDLVKTADYIIDLGPKGGHEGGYIMGVGSPEEIQQHATATGKALHHALTIDRKKRYKKLQNQKIVSQPIQGIDAISVHGAKEHHLKNLTLKIPRNQITCLTGPSGSGKSSLAFDTIYAEGQRRYVESLSAYMRQFIDTMPKPKMDYIDGLSPAIALDQGRVLKNPRSTVGTMTEAYDFLRILFARLGTAYCPETLEEIQSISLGFVKEKIEERYLQKKVILLAPIKTKGLIDLKHIKKELSTLGFLRIKLNDTYYELDEEIPFSMKKKNDLKVVIDRLEIKKESSRRLYESLEKAKEIGKDEIYVDSEGKETYFHLAFAVESTGKSYPPITAKSFLFNAIEGMCLDCLGLGFSWGSTHFIKEHFFEFSPEELIFVLLKDQATKGIIRQFIKTFRALEIDSDLPLNQMPSSMLDLFLKGGSNQKEKLQWVGLEQAIDRVAKSGKKEIKDFFHINLQEVTCSSCLGSRLNPLSSHVKWLGKTIKEITSMPIDELKKALNFSISIEELGTLEALDQLKKRLSFLENIGLGYLSLDRIAPTLSGGELQRIRLSKQLGASLSGCLYVLDEPTIGLHPHNNHLLNEALIALKNLNNTILCVEHDPMTVKIADHIIDFGPMAGKRGGEIMAQGSYESILKNNDSITGKYLSKKLELPSISYQNRHKEALTIKGAKYHNLQDVNFKIPLGKLTIITGVSGSGKSTILHDILYQNLYQMTTQKKHGLMQHVKEIQGIENIDKVILMEQGPIGQTMRADISTYSELLTPLRSFFSALPEAKKRGLQPKNFSFNHPKGMCPYCSGIGTKIIDLKFMSPIKVECPECHGYRLNPLSLKVEYQGMHLGKLLQLSVDEIIHAIPPINKAVKILNSLQQVGLGYLALSQEVNTLSGGEAQRLKLSKELVKSSTNKTIFLLDEPTTGLHYKDIELLISVLNSLLNKGCTVVMVEHHLDMIARADHIIDIGPYAGLKGGQVVFEGNVKKLLECQKSLTGMYLKNHLS